MIVVSWRTPIGDLQNESFEASKVVVKTDGPWLKILSKEPDEIVRIMPVQQVSLVQFVEGELPDKPRILRPDIAPSRFQPS